MLTDTLATELWILALCFIVNGVDAPHIGEFTVGEVLAWRFVDRPRA